ncbi:type II and III secretion system protein family protein [Cognatishimia activa]|uniref:Pectic enzymes secretion protein OutD n=1 Tax=Cognatishimia activa TaxID=1715691 RepID=A0A0P1IVH7_9RHOB|nr:type II and III secretion system protein family protein [Cognatishimia activa]CUJ18388.1 Pectic enzymes secretion protein OutD [Cognatishimia activa]CUK27595.1 Pectic enzymes secretion protein OutD [Cognatishimia activa]
MKFLAQQCKATLKAPFLGLLIALIAMAPVAQAQTQSITIDDGTVSKVEMESGRVLTVSTDKPFSEIVIGNTDILDVFPLTDNSLYIQSKRFGITNITLYTEDRRILEVVDVRVRADFSDLEASIKSAVPSSNIAVTNINNRVRLTGTARNDVDASRIVKIAQQYTSDPVINAMQIKGERQVELDVRIIEVERSSGRELGVSLTGTGSGGAGDERFATGALPTGVPFGTAVGTLLQVSGGQIDFMINALEGKGLARRLANPKLVTTSGIEANFVAGGEVPISVASRTDGVTTIATEYREFGVKLNFLPEVLDDELIRLRITPEVSDIDASINVNGEPGFTTRRARTTVSLRSGQSFAIAGLLQTNNARSIDQVPWLGQVPVLGALFRSTRFQKRESDLVILVTPRIVRPARPGEPLASPFDTTRSSDDVELFLMGLLEVDKDQIRNFRNGVGVVGPYGHMIELEFDDGVIKKK